MFLHGPSFNGNHRMYKIFFKVKVQVELHLHVFSFNFEEILSPI